MINLLIVNHLAEQENLFTRILLNRFITYFNRVFNSVTKAKMAGDVKFNRAKIKKCRREILFTKVS
jgi:hypothetical protein